MGWWRRIQDGQGLLIPSHERIDSGGWRNWSRRGG